MKPRTVQGVAGFTSTGKVVLPPYTFVFRAVESESEEYMVKRFFACIGALLMPPEGLDEHIESTIDKLIYYKEQAALTPPRSDVEPVRIVADRARVVSRPEFVVGE